MNNVQRSKQMNPEQMLEEFRNQKQIIEI